MQTVELEVTAREEKGKGASRRLRRSGLIPAVLYGKKTNATMISVPMLKMRKLVNAENVIIKLKGGNVDGKNVLIKDWDRNLMTREPLHIDFYEIDLTKSVRVFVSLNFIGKAKGVANGGLVNPVVREVEVECLPTEIPDHFDIDVSDLDVGDSLHIEDLAVPEGVKKVFHENYTVVTVTYIKEEAVAVVADAAATAAEPEVIAKGKEPKEGEAGAKPAAGAAKPAAAAPKK